ncbi:DUF3305 domain-containing protein [Rubrimonas cliftonensis]|uniref:DUF3305 domain-containing protein n=1 Tax=Rubrimonas cliftonensis TaxID=89524 RepID=A0A1H4D232_9RHOB|nr:DUF3305 domain-containing protein [Rubrimonas cliftonensis]SEA66815.1 Protein of unknown function [Rubrimonas cliftonensis]
MTVERESGGRPEGAAGEAPGEGFDERLVAIPVGVVVRRTPGVTRWARWSWRAVAVLPGAAPADWRELRREGEAVEYHAATVELELHRALTEGYRISLAMTPPKVHVVLHPEPVGDGGFPWRVHGVTASAHEALDRHESGEEMLEPVPMPPGLEAWIRAFCDRHHREQPFLKRQRVPHAPLAEDGVGDARVRQLADVYRAPGTVKAGALKPAPLKPGPLGPRRGDGETTH